MRSALGAALILFLSTAAPFAVAQTAKSSIEGMVRSGNNTPISGAHVTLIPADDDSIDGKPISENGLAEELSLVSTLSATTDDDGKFAISNVDPEMTYRMVLRASGYVRQEYGQHTFPGIGRLINLKPGQDLKGINVTLTPTGSIEGTVRAVSGEPLQEVRIRLLRYTFNRDGTKLLQLAASTTTNDLGRYRLYFLTPGRYYLHAERIHMHADFSRPSGTPFGPAYYPGESEISHASIIDIQPGVDRSGMDFSLSSQSLYRIRGRIIDGRTGRAIAKSSELLNLFDLSPDALPGGDGGFGRALFKETYSEDTGEFEFYDIPPGRYGIAGSTLGEEAGGVEIVRVDADVENVRLTYGSGTMMSGTLRADGRIDLSEAEIAIRPSVFVNDDEDDNEKAELSSEFKSASTRTFKFSDVFPGEYRLDIRDSTLPNDSYIKEARYGGIDALNQAFQISAPESRKLEIVIAPSGTLKGSLVNDQRMPLNGIRVVLIPNRLRNRPDLYKMEVADKEGHFEMHGIAPGDYKLFAWEAIEPYSWFDPEVIGRFETSGRAVHVTETSTQSVEVRVIPFVP